ncbi:MAG TPA: prohibitin family protein [Saprospiraceae bacterium]|nr:prohibitin family protein [Saprospiraceae bacterium]
MKNRLLIYFSFIMFALVITSCVTVRQGEIGVKRTLGKYSDKTYNGGLAFFNPFVSVVEKVSVMTQNLEVELSIPSKEGLNIRSEVSILYNVIPKKVPDLLRNIGQDYEVNLILPVFRSAVADVSSRYFAKDMHTGERAAIELAIRDQMTSLLKGKSVEIEAVLLKSVQMPPSLARAIEEKLEAEQRAQRMQFILQSAQQEAEQKIIEAKGTRDAQMIIAEGLDERILQFKALEAFMELSKSPNAKVIITGGNNIPLMMNLDETSKTPTPTTTRVSSVGRQ